MAIFVLHAGPWPGEPRMFHLPLPTVTQRPPRAPPGDGAPVLLAPVPPRVSPRPGGVLPGRQFSFACLSTLPLLLSKENTRMLIAHPGNTEGAGVGGSLSSSWQIL